MYNYLKPIASEEHMLNSTEIAELYGINTREGKPHSIAVSAILSAHKDYDMYYYDTPKGLMKVYPRKTWEPIMREFMDKTIDHNGREVRLKVNKKNYVLVIGR